MDVHGPSAVIVLRLSVDSLALAILKLETGEVVHNCGLVGSVLAAQQVILPRAVLPLRLSADTSYQACDGLHQDMCQMHCFSSWQPQPTPQHLLHLVLHECVVGERPLIWSDGQEERRKAQLLLHVDQASMPRAPELWGEAVASKCQA
eukprot:5533987-Amphidinium_carterae.1